MAWMVSWQEELARRQAEARQRIEELDRQLAEVQSLLEAEQQWLSELVLGVLADAGEAMRAVRISSVLGRGESAAKVEGLRGKLKRLTERGWLTEHEPGMFALAGQVRRRAAGASRTGRDRQMDLRLGRRTRDHGDPYSVRPGRSP